MNNRSIFALLIIASVIGFLWFKDKSENKYSWYRSYHPEKNQPYDLSVFFQTIKEEYKGNYEEIREKESLEENKSLLDSRQATIYMFAGRNCYLSRVEAEILKNHVIKGGTVFISAENLPIALMNELPALQIESNQYDAFDVVFRHPDIKLKNHRFLHYSRAKPVSGLWNSYYSDPSIGKKDENKGNDSGAISVVSSTYQSQPDFIRIRLGLGSLYLHANPVMFANVYQTLPHGREYFASVLRHLPGTRLIFDQSARIPKKEAETESEAVANRNFLDFIRSEPALWNAGQLLLITGLLFLAFAGRRKQRSIPVLEPPANHTMAFIDAIGRFYKNEQQNALVFRRERAQFYSFVQHQFRLRLTTLEEEELTKLSMKSGVALATLQQIAVMYSRHQEKSSLSDAELIEINKATSRFYNEYRNNYGKSGNTKRTSKPT